jgi:molecular chaperone DnaJ
LNLQEALSILEVPESINEADLKLKFKRLVLKYHPDRSKEPDATQKFIKIKEAYEIVSKAIKDRQKPETFRPFTITINMSGFDNQYYTNTTASSYHWSG